MVMYVEFVNKEVTPLSFPLCIKGDTLHAY